MIIPRASMSKTTVTKTKATAAVRGAGGETARATVDDVSHPRLDAKHREISTPARNVNPIPALKPLSRQLGDSANRAHPLRPGGRSSGRDSRRLVPASTHRHDL